MGPLEQAQAWAAEGESELQEFKTPTGSRSEGVRSLAVMANGRGGRVLFGVTPTGQSPGLEQQCGVRDTGRDLGIDRDL